MPDFDTGSGAATVSYLALEAPLYNTTLPSTAAAGADAYALKLAYWADIFNRRWDRVEGATDQFDVAGANRQNRLRLQAIWDGLSINGTNLKIFQTLGGATNTGGMSTSYNNTFGMSQLLRMNSGDASNLKASFSDTVTETTGTASAWQNVHGGWSTTLSSAQSGGNCGNGGGSNTAYSNTGSAGCLYMVQNRTRTDSKTRNSTWTPPADLNKHVFRISTQENVTDTGDVTSLTTPATGGGSAPNFRSGEGLHLYSPNINLPMGSLAQPLTAGVASDRRNLVLEVARIPNKASAYNAIYTDYTNNADILAKNCNVYRCGSDLTGALSDYQASSATHGSISIGTTNYNASTNTLTAYSGAEAVGVSFGALALNVVSTTNTVTTTEVQYQQRQLLTQTWRSASKCTTKVLGNCTDRTDQTGTLRQWQYYNGSAWVVANTAVALPSNVSQCSTAAFNGSPNCSNVSPAVTYDGTTYPACPDNASCTRYGTGTNPIQAISHNNGGATSSLKYDFDLCAFDAVTVATGACNTAYTGAFNPATSFSLNGFYADITSEGFVFGNPSLKKLNIVYSNVVAGAKNAQQATSFNNLRNGSMGNLGLVGIEVTNLQMKVKGM